MGLDRDILTDKKDVVIDILVARRRVLVALSGGVDSSVLLALAVEALGPGNVLAVTGRSDAVPEAEVEDARRVASTLGVRHEIVETREIERPEYRANAGDRCYHCRSELFELLEEVAGRNEMETIAYGAIREDLGDWRPGMRAAQERGIAAPLLEAGLTKDEVRALASDRGLPVRDKPASPCLASRIPVGTEVTPARLGQIARAEEVLHRLGFRQFRVRHHEDIARLELDREGESLIQDSAVRAQVVAELRQAGYRYVTIDLEGYRSGSLNPEPDLLHRIGPSRSRGQ